MIDLLLLRSRHTPGGPRGAPSALAEAAARAGYSVVALVDRHGVAGWPELAVSARELGLAAAPGLALRDRSGGEVLLLAYDGPGLSRLNRIATREAFRRPRGDLALGRYIERFGRDHFPGAEHRRGMNDTGEGAVIDDLVAEGSEGLFVLCESSLTASFMARHGWRVFLRLDPCRPRQAESRGVSGLPVIAAPLCVGAAVAASEIRRRCASSPDAVTAMEAIGECLAAFPLDARRVVRREGDDRADIERLRSICAAALPSVASDDRSAAAVRVDRELRVIASLGIAQRFLVVADLVRRFPRTALRGSAPSSLVSRLLGLSEPDPLREGLLFERFASPHRAEGPDFDVDFPWDERDAARDYLIARYPGRSALVASHRSRKSEGGGVTAFEGTNSVSVVICDGPLTDRCNVVLSPAGYPVCAWDRGGVAQERLPKIDLIANRSLAVLRDCVSLSSPPDHDRFHWRDDRGLDDPAVQRHFALGDTVGVYRTESPALRRLLAKIGRGSFDDVVIALALVRPGAADQAAEYIRRARGGSWRRFDPRFEAILEATYGIVVFQEDLYRVATEVAGMGERDADRFRRIVCAKSGTAALESMRGPFFSGAGSRGFDVATIGEAWRQITTFSGYSFTKAHAASCVRVAFRLAWMKAHRPARFYASLINHRGGYYGAQLYLDEARRRGIAVHGPDVNRSDSAYSVESEGIRIGIEAISGLSAPTVQAILGSRRERSFSGVDDFVVRVRPSRGELRSLVRSGALDSVAVPLSRPATIWVASRCGGQGSLFAPEPPEELREYSERTRTGDERETLGLYHRSHPLDSLAEAIAWRLSSSRPTVVPSSELAKCTGGNVELLACPVALKEHVGADGRVSCWASFEDREGVFETIVPPPVYAAKRAELTTSVVLLIAGEVSSSFGVPMVRIERLEAVV